jgi:hypothetical protein
MNISQMITDELSRQLEQCQNNIDNLSDVISMLQELLTRRQEDEDKLAGALYTLQNSKMLLPVSQEISSLILLEIDDYD